LNGLPIDECRMPNGIVGSHELVDYRDELAVQGRNWISG